MATHQAEAILAAGSGISALAWTHIDDRASALEYRRMMQAREDNRLARELALSGSRAAVTAQEAGWEPLRRWPGWDPERRVTGEPE